MTIAEYLEEKVRQQGHVDMLRKQLVYKFHALDAATEARLQARRRRRSTATSGAC